MVSSYYGQEVVTVTARDVLVCQDGSDYVGGVFDPYKACTDGNSKVPSGNVGANDFSAVPYGPITAPTHATEIASGATVLVMATAMEVVAGQTVTASSGLASGTKVLESSVVNVVNGVAVPVLSTSIKIDKATTGAIAAGATITFTGYDAYAGLKTKITRGPNPIQHTDPTQCGSEYESVACESSTAVFTGTTNANTNAGVAAITLKECAVRLGHTDTYRHNHADLTLKPFPFFCPSRIHHSSNSFRCL